MVVGLGTVHPTIHIVVGPVAHTACLSLFTLWKEDPKHINKRCLCFPNHAPAAPDPRRSSSLSKRHILPLLCNSFFPIITTCQPRVTAKRHTLSLPFSLLV